MMTKADVMKLPCKTSTDRAIVAVMLKMLDTKLPDKHGGADFTVRIDLPSTIIKISGNIPQAEA